MSNYLIKRNGIYYYRRRVPKFVMLYDKRKFVRISLETRDRHEGLRKSVIYNDYIEEYWRSLIKDNTIDPATEYDLAVKRAKIHGFTYKSVAEVSNEPIEDVIKRVLEASKAIESSEIVSSVLGGHTPPSLPLKELWNDFYAFKKPDLLGKSPKQLKRWKNPRIRAYETFIEVCGDIPAENITRDHILTFRAWWSDRLQEKNMSPNSANKDLTHFRSLLAFGQDNKDSITYDVTSLFARIRFKERDSERQPFETNYILSKILNHESLEGLNDECRYMLFALADTGARPSELVALDAKRGDIRLDTDIPYIIMTPRSSS